MMKKLFLAALLISAASGFCFAQISTKTVTAKTTTTTTTAQTGDSKAVRAAFDKLVKGIEESDVEMVMSVYQNSAATLYFNNNGSITRGWQQDKDNRERRYPKITNAKLTAKNVKVEMLGTGGAILTCEWTQTQDFDGKPETATGRMTLAFRKIGKDWKIVHLHTSPDRPDATRPVMPSERTEN